MESLFCLTNYWTNLHHRDASEPCGGERTVSAGAFCAIYHAAVLMGRDGYPAVNVADDEGTLIIA